VEKISDCHGDRFSSNLRWKAEVCVECFLTSSLTVDGIDLGLKVFELSKSSSFFGEDASVSS